MMSNPGLEDVTKDLAFVIKNNWKNRVESDIADTVCVHLFLSKDVVKMATSAEIKDKLLKIHPHSPYPPLMIVLNYTRKQTDMISLKTTSNCNLKTVRHFLEFIKTCYLIHKDMMVT